MKSIKKRQRNEPTLSTHKCVVATCTNTCHSRVHGTFFIDDDESKSFAWKDHVICGNNSCYSEDFWDTYGLFCLGHDDWGWICPIHCLVMAEDDRAYCPVCKKQRN